MKIAIYTHVFAPSVGGVETYVRALAEGLSLREDGQGSGPCKVVVLTSTPPAGFDDGTLPFQVVRQPCLGELIRLLRGADVVHVAGPSFLPMLLGWLMGRPVAVEHDVYQAVCPNGLLFYQPKETGCPGHFMARRYHECLRCNAMKMGWWKSLRMLLLTFPRRWLCRRMSVNIGPSFHVARRVALPRTETIYHGISSSVAFVQQDSVELSLPVCFTYVGRMILEKGVHVLLRSAKKLMDQGYQFRLKIIGDGPERAQLERMADELGLRGRALFTGFLTGQALQAATREASVAVMPSIWEDVAPLAAIEHMIQGRLLIASDLGGLGELVDGVGLKFPVGDVRGLADCLRSVLEQPELVSELGRKARERALRLFTQERMVDEHLRLYDRLLTADVGP